MLPGGRLLEQRDTAYELLTQIPGVTCVKPKGALYLFPRLDEHTRSKDDRQMVPRPAAGQKIMVVHGTSFSFKARADHFRIVTRHRPRPGGRGDRIGTFLDGYSQH